MPLTTTVIGAWPKPADLPLPDWFQSRANSADKSDCHDPRAWAKAIKETEDLDQKINKALEDVVRKQIDLGIDIITDGEIHRDNYVFDFARHLAGVDFEDIIKRTIRNGACRMISPRITGKIEPSSPEPWCNVGWKKTHKIMVDLWHREEMGDDAKMPALKYTIPGPMTLADCLYDQFYGEEKVDQLIEDLVKCVNKEVLALAQSGCEYIQIDEPVLMRYPDKAMAYGIDGLIKCFEGLPPNVTTMVHLCCGYPQILDQNDYQKADKLEYQRIAPKLDASGINQFSLEDAEAVNDLDKLLPLFKQSTVILGAITVARSRVATPEEIASRLKEALKYIPAERLVIAPDCGLGFLTHDLVAAKMKNMVAAAKSV